MTDGLPWLVLDRVEDVRQPPYCTHGKATCGACGHWVWLGSETHSHVSSGAAHPLCMVCAQRHAQLENKIGNIADHRRVDGPHL